MFLSRAASSYRDRACHSLNVSCLNLGSDSCQHVEVHTLSSGSCDEVGNTSALDQVTYEASWLIAESSNANAVVAQCSEK